MALVSGLTALKVAEHWGDFLPAKCPSEVAKY